MIKFLEEVIRAYIEFIEDYKCLIKSQGKDEAILRKERKGEIGGHKFWYHGAGCRLEKEGVICEFDYLPENGFPVKFTNWEIYEFINSHNKWKEVKYSLDDIHAALLNLVERNKLFLLEIEGVKFPIFQIKNTDVFK
ncbi:hypothetical protein LZQ00_05730 [Sphingobacterium sp. SRCM116780]|uniref:DUF6896 domain-containing protein n=1 Tax=Sphingobacterium sp. SRCM116780 TaxID=2907623 RepID=UPI001F338168|nr:hypothetical protein [Sphingobacterium sp. SRCM116780]UIR57314.1 hypothetical protein LZQ00_05730 [Sphingobacterium sp. SRCM116780]